MSGGLVDFLLARIAEDEERGRSLVAQWHDVGDACQSCGTNGARVLAECEAKRRIVGAYEILRDAGAESIVAVLALPYADHPDYDEKWRPEVVR